jgi:hypothetical protein
MSWSDYCLWRHDFGEVLDRRYYSLKWLDDQVLSGRVKLLTAQHAAILVEIRGYPTGAKDAHGLVAAGNLGEIVEILIPRAEQWGREMGCVGALIESREGWVRALKSSGYEAHQQVLRKEL